jgi:SNF2 family DNA or RNA helicase
LKENLLPGLDKDYRIVFNDRFEDLSIQKGEIKVLANARFNKDNGLFELDLEFYCGNLKLTMDDLLTLAEKSSKYLHRGMIYTDVVNHEEIRRLLSSSGQNILKSCSCKEEKLSLSLTPVKAIGFEQALSKCQLVEINAGSSFTEFIQGVKEKQPVQETIISPELRKILRHYQISGVNWLAFLVKYGLGGILADDMGLGKTLQILALLQSSKGQGTSIVICPKTLIYNWYEEIMKFTPEIRVLIPEGNAIQRKIQIESLLQYDLVITSYPLVRIDLENYSGFSFRYCILDEAQYIKNPDSETAKSVKAITAETRLAMTGTPMENSILELWSVFDYLMPGFLYDRKEFNEQFTGSPDLLREKIKPFILRRTKTEMLPELPPKIEQVLNACMDHEQLGMYMAVLESVRKSILDIVDKKSFDKSRMQVLAALMKLRQICNHPGLVNEEYLKRRDMSAKLELFEELINESIDGGHKVLVFSQFTSMLKILAGVLEENNILYSYLDGNTRHRGKTIKAFSGNSQVKVFLISLKAGGYGLNLTAADTVILFDPWWNPMAEEQAIDRIYRMGQDKPVNVYRLIAKGTVEEKIQALQQKKRTLFNAVIGENNDFIEVLSWEDIRQVLL